MFYTYHSSKIFAVIISCLCLISPVLAHTVKSDGQVGATFHIEPNHNPRAGEITKAWFALTLSGGKIIPLRQCDCQLKVYTQPEEKLVLNPTLEAISVEQYQDIPGAKITFPEAGVYQLEISGYPTLGASFSAFKLSYSVTVIPGKIPSTDNLGDQVDSQVNNQSKEQKNRNNYFGKWLIYLAIASIMMFLIGSWITKR